MPAPDPPAADSAPPTAHSPHRGRLFRKYLLLILTLVTLVLLVSSGINLYFSYQEHRAALASLQQEKAIGAASRIEQYVRQVSQQLGYAALPQLDAADTEARRLEFLKLLRQAPEVTDISQLDVAGNEVIAVSRLGMDVVASVRNRAGDPAFQQARRGQTWFGPVYFRKETEPYVTMAVRSGGGERGPVTVAEVNLKFIWDVVSRIRIGEKGKAYVVDASGLLVADPDIGLVLRKTNLSDLAHVKAATGAPDPNNPAMLSHDLRKTPVLASFAPIETLGWKVYIEQPISEVYAKLNASIVRTGLLLLAGLLLSALAASALARSMVRPIRTLDEGAQRIGAGELDQHITIRTGDELEGLADQFNRMSGQLRESYAGLERKVAERTTEMTEALEQQTATAAVLQVISNSVADAQPVFDAIVSSCQRLFAGQSVNLLLPVGAELRRVAVADQGALGSNVGPSHWPLDRESVTGAALLDGRVITISDSAQVARDYPRSGALAQAIGWKSGLFVPLLRDGVGMGCIAILREVPGEFTDKNVALARTFAEQAVIAIQNARLFNDTREALERQTATAEVLRVISGSVSDAAPVFDAILDSCERLFGAADSGIFLTDDNRDLRVGALRGILLNTSAHTYPRPLQGTMSGLAIAKGSVLHVPDLAESSETPAYIRELALRSGNFSVAVSPMLWEGRGIGTIDIIRTPPRPYTDKELALLETFADQAVIAIQNARLFNETKEALEHQTATSEVLRVISGSVADTQPVFEKILLSCATLFDSAEQGVLLIGDDGRVRLGAHRGATKARIEEYFTAPQTAGQFEQSIRERRLLYFRDVLNDPDVPSGVRAAARHRGQGSYSQALAPMAWEDRAVGSLYVTRSSAVGFSDKELTLLKTFADQAVIAIQNARLFQEIEDKSHQLEVANKHKSEFLANMSHELRTPLNAIIGFSEVLAEQMFGEVNDKQLEYLKDIHSSGHHLLTLINDILDLSKIEAGRMELELTSFDLGMLLDNSMTLVRERATRHGLTLALDVAPEVDEWVADQRKVKQVVINLLSNAVKFTPAGGKVTLRARRVESIAHDATAGSGLAVEIAVIDTGVGIAADQQAIVFEEFRQASGDYLRKSEGTGLGLALAKRFVELHGGAIRVESAPGQGATFAITLPQRDLPAG